MPDARGHQSELRKGRIAISGARYFVTAVTDGRKRGLTTYPIWAKFLELTSRDSADVWAAVMMPDHFHAFFVLPEGESPGDVMRRLKGAMTPCLREAGLKWQRNFFEHRLRPDEKAEPYLRYMLSNPHRAGLVDIEERWPFWAVTSPQAMWFVERFPLQRPEAAWLSCDAPWIVDG